MLQSASMHSTRSQEISLLAVSEAGQSGSLYESLVVHVRRDLEVVS